VGGASVYAICVEHGDEADHRAETLWHFPHYVRARVTCEEQRRVDVGHCDAWRRSRALLDAVDGAARERPSTGLALELSS
jgi:hypothetical protein